MSSTEKKEGATQVCKCGTKLICVKITKEWQGKTETKLQWQNESNKKPHFKFAGPGKFDCIIPEIDPEKTASQGKNMSTTQPKEEIKSLVNEDKINIQMDILLEIESIITKKLGTDPNPAKVGMYMKIIYGTMEKKQ